jgi:hypothetical protein
MTITVADVQAARRTIAGQILRTPMLPAPRLSALTGARVHVKYENLQVTNSFKERGALNKLASLTAPERRLGVIAMSAGNHAQAVAYHAARLSIPATIVMPVTTPLVKVEATQAHGATVVLEGETLVEAQAKAEAIARERNLTWVHPYDDALVLAGQGTIALKCSRTSLIWIPRDPDRGGRADRRQRDRRARAQAHDRDRRGGGANISVVLERADRRAASVRRCDAGRRYRREDGRHLDAADRSRAGLRDRAGGRAVDRARGQRLSHVAEDDG